MKTQFCFSLFFAATALVSAQCMSEYDTIRKNELSLNLLPVLIPVSGGTFDNTVNFQFGFRHYHKNKLALRMAFSYFPFINRSYESGFMMYDRKVGDRVVYKQYITGGGGKSQVSVGLEKIVRAKRFQHGIGFDLFFNHMYRNQGESYYYRPDSTGLTFNWSDTTNYQIDSLGYFNNEQRFGIGIQVFYSFRLKLTDRWYFSATIGPSFNYAFVSGNYTDRRRKTQTKGTGSTIDFPSMPLISDVSICYRF